MTTQKRRRLKIFALSAVCSVVGLGLLLSALRDNMMYFYTPTDLSLQPPLTLKPLRLGGIVQKNTYAQEGRFHVFKVGDGTHQIIVRYEGLLPDLFREGQGVVVEGHLNDHVFTAHQVLAKHDETYRPPLSSSRSSPFEKDPAVKISLEQGKSS